MKRGVIDRADGGIAWAAFDDGTREKKVTRAFSEGDAVLRREDGTWIPNAFLHLSVQTELFRPTIFKLYEENIGPLTPMIADILRDCEKDYPYEWIRDAVEEAVTNNARSWRYIESILRHWKETGQHGSY